MQINTPLDHAWTAVCTLMAKKVSQPVLSLAQPLLAEMDAAWRRGQPLFVEDILGEHPEIRAIPEVVLRILYEEIHLRRQAGQNVASSEVLERFPEWPQQIQHLLAICRGNDSERPSLQSGPKSGLEKVTTEMVDEMLQRWRAGDRPGAEEFLDRHPELQSEPESAVQLIYEEICLRQEQGECVSREEIIGRFPQWHSQLEVLLECHDLLSVANDPEMPAVHERLGEFFLLAQLGQGAQGQVFLAIHKTLADRRMVLKVTPCTGQEHISLARLQHTHIVPLYAVEDFPARHLRVLVFPYLGRVTWKHLFDQLNAVPLEERHGKHLLEILDQAEGDGIRLQPQQGPARRLLAKESYLQAVCRMGACLAETLQYAHERGLVHLDVKPSNVLLASDGLPLLLDFHLAQAPLEAGGPVPESLGGTPGYMAPEQERALAEVAVGQPVAERVDGRADLYSLGVLLYEALSGQELVACASPRPLSRCNPHVSIGLSDIIHKCLVPSAGERYANGASLADDLRRHLENRPLCGVANRSLAERWRKWRRRWPYLLPVGTLAVALFTALSAMGLLWVNQRHERYQSAENGLREGQLLLSQHRYADAGRALKRGQDLLKDESSMSPLAKSLAAHARIAQRANGAQELHRQVDALQFLYVDESLSPRMVFILEASARTTWDERTQLLNRARAPLETKVEETLRKDLLELAICLADLRVRLRQGEAADAMRREALKNLDEAEALFGQSPVLFQERQRYARALGLTDLAKNAEQQAAANAPRSAWDHFAVGRGLMRVEKFAHANAELESARKQQPHHFWTNFCLGICARKLERPQDAVEFFSVCVGQMPHNAECFVERGQAYAALGRYERAYQDYSRGVALRPEQAEAFLRRGILDCRHQRVPEGLADLARARDLGADPATVYYNLALGRLAQEDRAGALDDVKAALRHRPNFPDAQKLNERLLKKL